MQIPSVLLKGVPAPSYRIPVSTVISRWLCFYRKRLICWYRLELSWIWKTNKA